MNIVALESLDWTRLVGAGEQVVCSQLTSEPVALLRALAAAAPHQGRFGVYLATPFSDAGAAFPQATVLTTYGGIGSAGAIGRNRRTRVALLHYSHCAVPFESGSEAVNLMLVSLARSRDGTLCLGGGYGYTLAAARRARRVIAEINDQAPAVPGAPWPADIPIEAAVEVSYPVMCAADPRATETDLAIAAQVAPLVSEGACLQVGIGAMPSAVLASLAGHRGLGLHSGMLTVPVQRLIESGAMDNSRKALDAGRAVTGCVYGDAALYKAAHDNPAMLLRPPLYTHGAAEIAQLDHFTAINSALEIDLLGQANAETVPGADGRIRYVGGIGGLCDYVRTARLARGGQAMLALPSRQTGKSGNTPRIVAALSGPATVSASDADLVATEYGVARLRDASMEERATRLIAIAHPEDREGLTLAARRLGYLA